MKNTKKVGNAEKETIRTTISHLSMERARRLMDQVYGISDYNELFERLIMDEYERRHGKVHIDEPRQDGVLILNEVAHPGPGKQKKKVA